MFKAFLFSEGWRKRCLKNKKCQGQNLHGRVEKRLRQEGWLFCCVLTDPAPCISYVVVSNIATTAVEDGCRGYGCLPDRAASVSVLSRNWGNSAAVCVCSWRESGALGPGMGEGHLCAYQTSEVGSTVGTLLSSGTWRAELQCSVCLQSLAWAACKHWCEEKPASRVDHLCPLRTWNTWVIESLSCSSGNPYLAITQAICWYKWMPPHGFHPWKQAEMPVSERACNKIKRFLWICA